MWILNITTKGQTLWTNHSPAQKWNNHIPNYLSSRSEWTPSLYIPPPHPLLKARMLSRGSQYVFSNGRFWRCVWKQVRCSRPWPAEMPTGRWGGQRERVTTTLKDRRHCGILYVWLVFLRIPLFFWWCQRDPEGKATLLGNKTKTPKAAARRSKETQPGAKEPGKRSQTRANLS